MLVVYFLVSALLSAWLTWRGWRRLPLRQVLSWEALVATWAVGLLLWPVMLVGDVVMNRRRSEGRHRHTR